MITVALVGADGSGKTTVSRRLLESLPLPSKYLYMGVNSNSGNLVLPTTQILRKIRRARGIKPRYGPPDPARVKAPPKNRVLHWLLILKSLVGMINQMAEEWLRQGVLWYYQRRGYVILLDRHIFLDCYAHEIAGDGIDRPLHKRLHGWMLKNYFPKPDLVICLDAPAEVLVDRKMEGTLELRERRRQEYLDLSNVVDNFAIVDAAQSEDEVTRRTADIILNFYFARMGRTVTSQ
jgi:thymidylate kinase